LHDKSTSWIHQLACKLDKTSRGNLTIHAYPTNRGLLHWWVAQPCPKLRVRRGRPSFPPLSLDLLARTGPRGVASGGVLPVRQVGTLRGGKSGARQRRSRFWRRGITVRGRCASSALTWFPPLLQKVVISIQKGLSRRGVLGLPERLHLERSSQRRFLVVPGSPMHLNMGIGERALMCWSPEVDRSWGISCFHISTSVASSMGSSQLTYDEPLATSDRSLAVCATGTLVCATMRPKLRKHGGTYSSAQDAPPVLAAGPYDDGCKSLEAVIVDCGTNAATPVAAEGDIADIATAEIVEDRYNSARAAR